MSKDFASAIYYWLSKNQSSQVTLSQESKIPLATVRKYLQGNQNSSVRRAEQLAISLKIPKTEHYPFVLLARGRTRDEIKKQTGQRIDYLPITFKK